MLRPWASPPRRRSVGDVQVSARDNRVRVSPFRGWITEVEARALQRAPHERAGNAQVLPVIGLLPSEHTPGAAAECPRWPRTVNRRAARRDPEANERDHERHERPRFASRQPQPQAGMGQRIRSGRKRAKSTSAARPGRSAPTQCTTANPITGKASTAPSTRSS